MNPPKHQKLYINIISILKLIFIHVCPPGLQTKNIHVIILLVWSRDDWKAEALLAIIEHFVNCKNLSDPVISHTLDFVGMVAWIIKCEGHFFPVNGWQGMPGETSSSSPIGDTRSSRDQQTRRHQANGMLTTPVPEGGHCMEAPSLCCCQFSKETTTVDWVAQMTELSDCGHCVALAPFQCCGL